ncbi:MAG: hypothetical protein JO053_06495 [Acidobacteria bacterium]|nr:hypothetical protein [Acidobacteriota bacterium]
MTTESFTGPPSVLEHDLNKYFPELLKFESTPEMEASAIWPEIREDVERILNALVVEDLSEPPALAGGQWIGDDPTNGQPPHGGRSDIKALAWNLERGIQFEGIADGLANHPDLKGRDVLMLPELDVGMARSNNRFVARELAERLKLNYAFAPIYIPLQKGSGVEAEMKGENTLSIHGIAMMSPWPMTNVHAIPLPNGKDKMWGKEKRIGYLRAIVADIQHPSGAFRGVSLHLDVHCSRAHRRKQVQIILDHLDTLPPLPTILGGDWNTTTFNAQTATRAILGYWRRVMMGVKNVAKNHFPHPDRYFERNIFTDLESRGYEYKNLNERGVGTLHYHIESIEKNTNLRDWVPAWCFKFIFWAARRVGGSVSVRLDWFVAKGFKLAPGSQPRTVTNLFTSESIPLSDHDAITVDLVSVART